MAFGQNFDFFRQSVHWTWVIPNSKVAYRWRNYYGCTYALKMHDFTRRAYSSVTASPFSCLRRHTGTVRRTVENRTLDFPIPPVYKRGYGVGPPVSLSRFVANIIMCHKPHTVRMHEPSPSTLRPPSRLSPPLPPWGGSLWMWSQCGIDREILLPADFVNYSLYAIYCWNDLSMTMNRSIKSGERPCYLCKNRVEKENKIALHRKE